MKMTDYDLVIIGAGIHGAAIARAASYDGYKVCIIEQYHQAGLATSSRSSKLIHGGLRYLESYQFRLVKECLHERAILLRTAPSLVKLVPFYIPVYKFNKRPAWLISTGLFIYRLLGGGRFRKVPESEWSTLDSLDNKQLKAVFEYHDAITDDKKLTQHVLNDAINQGAEFKADCEFISATLSSDKIQISLKNHENIKARLLINASGPWVNEVLQKITPQQNALPIDLVQGTHIVIPRTIDKGIYYVEATDQRVIFAIPWQQHCLIGTTETPFRDKLENTQPLPEEIEYLLSTWNQYFNDKLTADDIINSFSGLRVLPGSDSSAFNRSRDTLLHTDNADKPKVISIYGGKLTAHRATAESVMHLIHQQLPGHIKTDTSKLNL